jgi:hypothetical protein
MANKKEVSKEVNTAEFGRKYYDIVDVFSQKLMSQIVELKNDTKLSDEAMTKLSNVVMQESTSFKDWGFDQLIKVVKK